MLKKYLLLILIALPIIGLGLNNSFADNSIKDYKVFATHQEFNYEDLKDASPVIALVRVQDDLDASNSVIYYNENSPAIEGFFGRRQVEVLEYYKDERNLGNNISIIEPAVITDDNEYIHAEEYEKMDKDKTYIVFLSDETASGELSILSANNGKIDVSNLSQNEYKEIAIKSLLEFESSDEDISTEQKELLLNSQANDTINKSLKRDSLLEISTIKTNFGELKVKHYYDEIDEKEYMYIDGIELISEEKIFSDNK